MAVEAYLPTLATVFTTAAIDSINPCAIGVLILMLSVLVAGKKSTSRMLVLGSLYITSVLTVYLLAGIGLMYGVAQLPLFLTEYISIGVALIIIAAGSLEIKDFYWYGKGISLHIPVKYAKMIHKWAEKGTIPAVIFLGAFVSAVELPCTGAPYLAIIILLSQYFDFSAFLLLVFYNIIFVAPLIIILLLVAAGVKLQAIKNWKQMNRGYMRLFIGLLLVALGWILMMIANGTINLG